MFGHCTKMCSHIERLIKVCKRSAKAFKCESYTDLEVVMGATLGTGTFKPEKNLVFFRIKSPGPHRCHPGKLE